MFRQLDTKPIDAILGKAIPGPQLKEPVTVQDIRAWVQAMHNPNPIHFDEEAARRSRFERIVGPQSFAAACEHKQGVIAALEGFLPGAHELWGGVEWRFNSQRIVPGDSIRCERVPVDYKVVETRFAGPTVFQRGDTIFLNGRGEELARMRTTAVRYLVENMRIAKEQQDRASGSGPEPLALTEETREQVEQDKQRYYAAVFDRAGAPAAVPIEGGSLPAGVVGPHSVATFTTEWRAYLCNRGWGATVWDPDTRDDQMRGFSAEFTPDRARARLDPAQMDIVYYGPARGHLDPEFAQRIGMPRPYGFGVSIGCWALDYVSNWAGPDADIIEAKYRAQGPVFAGEATYLKGKVSRVGSPGPSGRVEVAVSVQLESFPTSRIVGTGEVKLQFLHNSGK